MTVLLSAFPLYPKSVPGAKETLRERARPRGRIGRWILGQVEDLVRFLTAYLCDLFGVFARATRELPVRESERERESLDRGAGGGLDFFLLFRFLRSSSLFSNDWDSKTRSRFFPTTFASAFSNTFYSS